MHTVALDRLEAASGHLPRRARLERDRLGRVVAAVTAEPAGAEVATDQPCAQPDCAGTVWGARQGDTVQWWCPHCADAGRITGWLGSRWAR